MINLNKENIYFAILDYIKVRKENFGLLFYNSKSTKMTFVKSKDIIKILTPNTENKKILIFISKEDFFKKNIKAVITSLREKGFITEINDSL
ncbi:MAG: mycofactocin biosynthesis chaperone MftB [Candidatus Goldbacteria bacterium]|nr:mycofactocin biosynthesis chaperone MftB [Candidatus Goldiibacteriota bacterium]